MKILDPDALVHEDSQRLTEVVRNLRESLSDASFTIDKVYVLSEVGEHYRIRLFLVRVSGSGSSRELLVHSGTLLSNDA